MNGKSRETQLTFGFDIGVASVGWAVLAPSRIVALGVRAFDKAETAKEGESLNLARRMARLMRRRLRHRNWRLRKVVGVLRHHFRGGLAGFDPRSPSAISPWKLRVEGLERKLDPEQWARVLYHLCKHRGFHWTSRAEERKAAADAKSEGGKVKQGLARTAALMRDKRYRTAAEMILSEFPHAQRNKRGDYAKALSRVQLGNELAMLFDRQRAFGNPDAGTALEARVLGDGDARTGLFWTQQPPLSGQDLLKMLGKCTFERTEYRAPKASFTAERHVWLTRLNNLRVVIDGRTRALADEERRLLITLPYVNKSGALTYKQARATLLKSGLVEASFRFAGLAYPSEAQRAAGDAKDPEASALVRLTAWHEIGATLQAAGLQSEWQRIQDAALGGNADLLDEIAWVLSVYKDDAEVASELAKLKLPTADRMADALLDLRFDKFHALSIKALRKIVPLMEAGLRYDEACASVGYVHHAPRADAKAEHRLLPPLYAGRDPNGRMVFDEGLDVPRNPVVLRSLNQARKVLNALVREYGSPDAVHIEMARDLSRPLDERRRIEGKQLEFRGRNEREKAEFAANFAIAGTPRGGDFEKWRLYHEQGGKCAYSIEPIDLGRLLEPGYVDVDHALPYSRSFDDSKNNKVLAKTSENRNKGNRTPYEYLGGAEDNSRWRAFVAFVNANKQYRLAKRSRLLRKDFSGREAAEFRERNLNDTRYACRFFKNYVEQSLRLADGSEAKRCVVLSGQLTAFLRTRWGLLKSRDESDRHHALDAIVVAACSHAMVKRLSDHARRRELEQVRDGYVDPETGEILDLAKHRALEVRFPEPWPLFRHELEARLKLDDPEALRAELARVGTYADSALAAVRPLFVSRAPQRRSRGAAHKETVYAQPPRMREAGSATQRVALSALTLRDLDRLVDPDRNARLYSAIRDRLQQYGGKGDKAFPPDNPLRKPDRNGAPTGPVVRSVKLVIDRISGVPVRGGIAMNDSMIRVDVFRKKGRHFLIPIYVHHVVASSLPMRAIVQGRDEANWTEIDDTFEWRFSLHPNDLIRVALKDAIHTGYFAGCDRSTGAISLWTHDRNALKGKEGLIRSIGVKTALAFDRFDVDILGTVYPASTRPRSGLA